MMNIYSIECSLTDKYGCKETVHYYEDAENVGEACGKFLERAKKEKIRLARYDNIKFREMVKEI